MRRAQPDVVLVDIGLPGIDGFELARRIRATEGDRRTLLVALTGYGRDEDRERTRAAGFDHHLTKPVELDALEGLVARLAVAGERSEAASTLQ
jgi:CheY-like chemotaxis protein